jgi:Zn-dependent M28 family amino/carboxypeptidase
VKLSLGAVHHPDSTSRNVIADVVGREKPDEAVVVGCHFDSWDVGQGAQDDGAGCLIAWEAARLISEMEQAPRRTVRVVLFTNEENGLRGGRAYAAEQDDMKVVAAFESDTGNGRADGFRVDLRAEDIVRAQAGVFEMTAALQSIGGGTLLPGYAGADVGPLAAQGIPSFGMRHDTTTYWPIHHTRADTFEKVVLEDLQHNAGLMAAAVWLLAEAEGTLLDEKRRRR